MSRSSINSNSTSRGWLWIVLLLLPLAACTPELIPAPTMTPFPTATSTPLPPTFTPTATIVYPTSSPIPTQPPPPIFTPDAIQVERWQEYQTDLAKVLLYGYGPDAYKDALCEWDILGRSTQEVYVWAYCAIQGGASNNIPAVIHLEEDGSIQTVKVPIRGSSWNSMMQDLFPVDVQEKIYSYYSPEVPYTGRPETLRIHLHYRREHPEEPPLVILSATPAP